MLRMRLASLFLICIMATGCILLGPRHTKLTLAYNASNQPLVCYIERSGEDRISLGQLNPGEVKYLTDPSGKPVHVMALDRKLIVFDSNGVFLYEFRANDFRNLHRGVTPVNSEGTYNAIQLEADRAVPNIYRHWSGLGVPERP